MNTYKIQITETLSRVIEIQASDLDEALHTVEDDYKREAIVLDADDCVEYEIEPWQADYQIAAGTLAIAGVLCLHGNILVNNCITRTCEAKLCGKCGGKIFPK